MRTGLLFADRTAVLFLGVAAGVAIGYAFGAGGDTPPPAPAVPPTGARAEAGSKVPALAPAAIAAKPEIAQECALPFQPHLLQAVAADKPVTVGVFGDSFGDGVWTALYRLLPAREKYRVLKYSQQSTGFTRYGSRNLEEHAAAQIAADGPVDVAVISFGANDTQGVYADGHAAPLMSPEWQRVVGGRIEGFVRLMRSRGAVVYWLGLPKMRAVAFDADIAAMNAFYERKMKALQVPFIDIRPLTVDATGEYAPYLPDPVSHEMRLMRANDGVHMSMNGYVAITRSLADRIKSYVGAARVMAGVVPAVTPPPPVVPPATAAKPPEPRAALPKPVATPEASVPARRVEPETTKPAAEAAPTRPKAEAPIAKPKVEPVPAAKPKPDTAAPTKPRVDAQPAKPKPDAQPAAKPKAEATPIAKPKPESSPAAKPKVETPAAKPKAESPAAAKPQSEAKPKPDVKPSARTTADKPATKPAPPTTPKPATNPAPRAPLQLNLPPPEESRRTPSAPPPTDQP
jgi:hypothetical protein